MKMLIKILGAVIGVIGAEAAVNLTGYVSDKLNNGFNAIRHYHPLSLIILIIALIVFTGLIIRDLITRKKLFSKIHYEIKTSEHLNLGEILTKPNVIFGAKDALLRSTGAHMRIHAQDLRRVKKRTGDLPTPTGYYAFKDNYGNWVMNRGHLLAHELTGIDDVPENFAPITRYLNAGSSRNDQVNDNNPNSMIYYENRLHYWLLQHPYADLDYAVVPNYDDSDLVPTSISLIYGGIVNDKVMAIHLSANETTLKSGLSCVTLPNVTPALTINYRTGQKN